MKTCNFCNKECKPYKNYCDFQCMIEEAKQNGGKVIAPNNLPIRCIKYDGTMLEHEDAGHPDYIFPIDINYLGEVSEHDKKFFGNGGETHALVFADGYRAISIYETCYCYWRISNEESTLLMGSLWSEHDNWKISKESLQKMLEYSEKKRKEIA